ncbi:hypothetical protein HXX76_007542 [Chlamydomonas incerta]|uniref:mannan endo-1,4-beta-mannosidase n=1 Tax=Chlamydomonas incerta TaxID=51695 RepID=A0A835SWZ2_CHLIN|nr:hypothetical protein HXX76_007542 [Chlamydomonas incerta]|eukprot:KAG2434648.1 hypothetical protein HXX76_007542 [Chlamydomonas incerta]
MNDDGGGGGGGLRSGSGGVQQGSQPPDGGGRSCSSSRSGGGGRGAGRGHSSRRRGGGGSRASPGAALLAAVAAATPLLLLALVAVVLQPLLPGRGGGGAMAAQVHGDGGRSISSGGGGLSTGGSGSSALQDTDTVLLPPMALEHQRHRPRPPPPMAVAAPAAPEPAVAEGAAVHTAAATAAAGGGAAGTMSGFVLAQQPDGAGGGTRDAAGGLETAAAADATADGAAGKEGAAVIATADAGALLLAEVAVEAAELAVQAAAVAAEAAQMAAAELTAVAATAAAAERMDEEAAEASEAGAGAAAATDVGRGGERDYVHEPGAAAAAAAGGGRGLLQATARAAGPSVISLGPRYTKDTTAVDSADVILIRPPLVTPSPPVPPKSEFVSIRGHQFIDPATGRPFYFIGFNAHWLPNLANFEHEWGRTQAAHFMASAQRLGMRVGRWWAFNRGLPLNPGEYDEDQFLGLDYTLYLAAKFGLRVILALTNLWPQYKGPEHYLYMATGSAEGKTVLDYYRDRSTRELVKRHFDVMVNRVNAYSGRRYGDDPAILGWDVMNEPRCPGCSPAEVGIKLDWLREMAAYLRTIDSNHLITQGSEGYFMPDPETNAHLLNPGAGAQCEGEDWVATVSMKNHDFACVHVYERQVEALPFNYDPRRNDPTWKTCDFVCYINWLTRYMEAHVEVARRISKPLLLEEYGLTWWRMWEYDRRVLLQVTFEQLIDSARAGGPLAGALFWNAAANFTGDYDGYNIYISRTPKAPRQPAPFAYGPTAGSVFPGPNPVTVPSGSSSSAAVAAGGSSSSSSRVPPQPAAKRPTASTAAAATAGLAAPAAAAAAEEPTVLPAATLAAAPTTTAAAAAAAAATATAPLPADADALPAVAAASRVKRRRLLSKSSSAFEDDVADADDASTVADDNDGGGGGSSGGGSSINAAAAAAAAQGFIRLSDLPGGVHPALLELLEGGQLGPLGGGGPDGGGGGGSHRSSGGSRKQARRRRRSARADGDAEGWGPAGGVGAGGGGGGGSGGGRRLREVTGQMDALDGFRRAWQRNDCAVRNSVVWRPPPIPSHVNYTAYRAYVEGMDAVDIIAWATAQLPN